MAHTVTVKLPLDINVLTALLNVLGQAWPESTISGNNTEMNITLGGPASGADIQPVTIDEAAVAATLLSMRDGTFGVGVDEWLTTLMVGSFKHLLTTSGAENYVEMKAIDKSTGAEYVCTVLAPDGKSPHQLRQDAEQKAGRYAAKLAELGVDVSTI